MTITAEQEYRLLELESSNLLMEQDGRRALGEDTAAARAARRAGELRERMAYLRQQSGEFVEAAEDWLSASACYLQANALLEAQAVVNKIEELQQYGRIPAEREDLLTILQRRKQDVHALAMKNGSRAEPRTSNGSLAAKKESVREKDG